MATFEQLFPTFLQKCAELHELLRLVAFLLFIVAQHGLLRYHWHTRRRPE